MISYGAYEQSSNDPICPGPVVAAIGWYVAANENYKKNRSLETQREERERRGVIRQANLLLRVVIKNLEPFFYAFKSLQLNDVWRLGSV